MLGFTFTNQTVILFVLISIIEFTLLWFFTRNSKADPEKPPVTNAQKTFQFILKMIGITFFLYIEFGLIMFITPYLPS